jgi:hypothetical protein
VDEKNAREAGKKSEGLEVIVVAKGATIKFLDGS